ncbi:hypothetical protein [Flavobacterium lacisediminis]|uniref:C1q domain-containing protein n=1 Tax=Flavobacterium lacisediminis TaxID=2989705 RepID=A0ABT3EE25_9FLAO|nr:hypothetical protein [Flavobacterium lacisediminis]MCW1146832.1 hypothetical protein [Flavobacterium lacisediminis]
MKKHYIKLLIWFVSTTAFSQVQGVGINEDTPQQALHLGSSSGTIRVDGLNATNSTYNGGGTETYPLYVDGDGNLTLEFKPIYNSNGSDALDHAILPGSVVTLPAGDNDGVMVGELFNFTIAVNRASILEVKYNVSMDVFLNPAETAISDRRARRVNTFFQVNGAGRKYGQSAKCYTGGSADSETGKLFNTSTSYITLPAAGSYVIRFYGEVSSGITNSTANTGLATCVKFARGNDTLLFRLH